MDETCSSANCKSKFLNHPSLTLKFSWSPQHIIEPHAGGASAAAMSRKYTATYGNRANWVGVSRSGSNLRIAAFRIILYSKTSRCTSGIPTLAQFIRPSAMPPPSSLQPLAQTLSSQNWTLKVDPGSGSTIVSLNQVENHWFVRTYSSPCC